MKIDENGHAYYTTEDGSKIEFAGFDPETSTITLSVNGKRVNVRAEGLSNKNGGNNEQD